MFSQSIPRHTKIISTLGPASSDRETIAALIEAGTDVVRLNFSHGEHETHRKVVALVREEADKLDKTVTILQDLQGPRIRVSPVEGNSVMLNEGSEVMISASSSSEDLSTGEHIYISYKALAQDIALGGKILMDDGRLALTVLSIKGDDIRARVDVGGILKSRKGVNLPHVRTSGPALTEKDLADLEVGIDLNVDWIALSFVRNETDVVHLRKHLKAAGHRAGVISKIEKPEAFETIDHILAVSDGIMVARGDLGIEMPMSSIPHAQKTIIHKCLLAGKPVITATQMLESMIEDHVPTRAEASDVANAVLDGTDAVMLSGETAVGQHPAHVVNAMARIITAAEEHWYALPERSRGLPEGLSAVEDSQDVTDAVSLTACELAKNVGARALVCLTASGATARALAKHRPRMPVYAFTDSPAVIGQVGVLWGTKAFKIPFQSDTDAGVRLVQQTLVSKGYIRSGDTIVISAGMPLPRKGRTNLVHVSYVD
ncbi:MAG: pyruvate kinase [Bacteroidetes bacterium]|nr:pyruvate kinase [Bacteroidota bacterium]